MTAIMGPSGAGKTTLLNILSGHYDRGYEGEVQVNGYVREAKLFNLQSCYVMQDDCLLGYLTVRETLAMSVELRTSTRGRRKISEMVEDALELWGLQGCANTLARSLSGGERKRLVIAQELMSDVPVVFLDEPTSGLDSCSALRCVRVLKTLADNGRTVLCSLHNPSASVFSQFDRTVVFMASPLCAPFIVFSGFFVQIQYLLPAVAWLPSVSHMFYAHRAIVFAVYGGGRGEIECDESTNDKICVPVDGNYVLDRLSASDVNLFVNFGALLAIDGFLKLATLCLLKWRLWRNR
ncbi:hypothetical protein HPB52_005332 [Rhipicephalus sanguineus]|uniref:ABC transporter domain-containing protein n=1 Tax=Rhipicephalus sanguineus TaxID=34632 RepID=A0A9D4PQS5_RHISA|nr:hypothetical protein HPB52_005332 [Rhipicephalus sanguineus]